MTRFAPQDFYFKEARRLGYVARSAFKLQEVQRRHGVIKRGGAVLDLGCCPGAWLQVACQSLGPMALGGCVVGVDIQLHTSPLSTHLPSAHGRAPAVVRQPCAHHPSRRLRPLASPAAPPPLLPPASPAFPASLLHPPLRHVSLHLRCLPLRCRRLSLPRPPRSRPRRPLPLHTL
ncbi:hypothetical protein CLOM_g21923 [Closterium sp. NIES-68]|nr:hypothetical protein CLOM_g21923 [Closterium sp. NIES-68]